MSKKKVAKSKKVDKPQIWLLAMCSLLIIGGLIGLFTSRNRRISTENHFKSLEDYLEEEEAHAEIPPEGVLTEEEVRAVVLEVLPEKGNPAAYEYEEGEWEAKYPDGTEIKMDAFTGEVLEIEQDDDDD